MTKDVAGRGIYLRGAVYWLTWYQAGKKCFASLETSDYAEAVTRARDIRIRPTLMAAGGFIEEVERFLAYKRRRNEFSKTSAHARFYILRHFAKWVDVPVCNVTAAQVQAFYDWKLDQFGAVTANDYAMILRSFFNWAVNIANVCRRNPVADLDPAESETRGLRLKDFCSADQRDRLIRSCKREDLAFVLYSGFHAGLRKNEIIEARPWWFNVQAGILHLRETPTIKFKDREERSIPLTNEFSAFLKVYGLREPYMLQPKVKHGKNRYRYDFSKPFFQHLKAQKLEKVGQTKVTPHLMRHTFASLLATAGVSLYKIAIWMGDAPGVVEERYARIRPRDEDIERAFHSGETTNGHEFSRIGGSGNSIQ